MNSVTIKKEAFTDPRIKSLAKELNLDFYSVIGRLACIWGYCTDREIKVLDEKTINIVADHENFCEFLKKNGLCEESDKNPTLFYIKGAKKHTTWLAKKRKDSRKGGASTRRKWRATDGATAKATQRPDGRPNEGPITITIPITTTNNKDLLRRGVGNGDSFAENSTQSVSLSVVDNKSGLASRDFIAAMVTAYRSKYKDKPVLDGKTLGQIKTLLKHVPLNRAIDMYQVYLQLDDQWFKTKCHDFTTFTSNLQKISVSLTTGEKNTSTNWDWIKDYDK